MDASEKMIQILTWSADGRFDASLLDVWNTVDGAFNVDTKHFPVEIEQRERKLSLYLMTINNQ